MVMALVNECWGSQTLTRDRMGSIQSASRITVDLFVRRNWSCARAGVIIFYVLHSTNGSFSDAASDLKGRGSGRGVFFGGIGGCWPQR